MLLSTGMLSVVQEKRKREKEKRAAERRQGEVVLKEWSWTPQATLLATEAVARNAQAKNRFSAAAKELKASSGPDSIVWPFEEGFLKYQLELLHKRQSGLNQAVNRKRRQPDPPVELDAPSPKLLQITAACTQVTCLMG